MEIKVAAQVSDMKLDKILNGMTQLLTAKHQQSETGRSKYIRVVPLNINTLKNRKKIIMNNKKKIQIN